MFFSSIKIGAYFRKGVCIFWVFDPKLFKNVKKTNSNSNDVDGDAMVNIKKIKGCDDRAVSEMKKPTRELKIVSRGLKGRLFLRRFLQFWFSFTMFFTNG